MCFFNVRVAIVNIVFTCFIKVPSLGAPGKVVMTKHSSDTILLQWTPPDVADRLSLILGYRVYVNGIEEGMVGYGRLCFDMFCAVFRLSPGK